MAGKKQFSEADRIIRSLEDGFLRADNNGFIVMANEAIAEMCGYENPEEMIGLHMKDLYANPSERDHLIAEILEKGKIVNQKVELLRQDGSSFMSLCNIKSFYNDSGSRVGTEGVIRDITEIHRTEEELDHANKVLGAIRSVNQMINVEKNPAKLLKGICESLTKDRGYHNVWIMQLDDKGLFKSVFQSGLGKEFQQVERMLKKGDFTSCAIKTLKQKDIVVISNPKEKCSDCPLAKLYEERGAMAAPIYHNKKLYGLITASIPRKFLTQYDFHLFKEVADDIGLALDSIEAKEQSRRLTEVVNSLPQPISLVSPDYRYVAVNKVYADYFQVSTEEITGATISEFLGEDVFYSTVKPNLEKCLQGDIVEYEVQTEFAGRGKVWMHMEYYPYYDENGQISGVMSHGTDITDRKKASEKIIASNQQLAASELELKAAIHQLRESELKLKNIIDNSTNLFYSHSPDHKLSFVSPQVRHYLGCEPEEAMREWTNFITDNPINRIGVERTQKAIETGERQPTYELELRRKDGSTLFVEVREAPVVENGKVVSVVGSLADISDRKIAERNLLEAKEKAEESDRLKSAFLANMSHEIRTPMNGILGFANLLNDTTLSSDDQQRYISIIEHSGERMLNIINDIIDISKIESGLMEVNISQVNINEQLNNLLSFFEPEAERKNLDLVLKGKVPEDNAIVKTDGEKVMATLTNLIKNAIKYTDHGVIVFGCNLKEYDDSLFLEYYVKDTGIGISEKKRKAIFERFIQEDIEDIHARQGAGLGLSISQAYVKMLGGEIWLESEKGVGSVFYFTIPCGDVKDNEKPVDSELTPPNDSKIRKLKIIVAEDDQTSKDFISIIIGDLAREIIFTGTGADTVEECRKNPDTELILMDIQMPDMNGYSATEEIRRFNTDVKIIAQTAYGLSGDKEKSIKAGCNAYIPKPVKKDELIAMIEDLFYD